MTDCEDGPSMRALVDTGASVRRIVDVVRTRLADPECRVTIQYITDAGWLFCAETTRGAVIRSSWGDERVETLVELFDKFIEAVEHSEGINGRRGPRPAAEAAQ